MVDLCHTPEYPAKIEAHSVMLSRIDNILSCSGSGVRRGILEGHRLIHTRVGGGYLGRVEPWTPG